MENGLGVALVARVVVFLGLPIRVDASTYPAKC